MHAALMAGQLGSDIFRLSSRHAYGAVQHTGDRASTYRVALKIPEKYDANGREYRDQMWLMCGPSAV